jgi:hypothetical protein
MKVRVMSPEIKERTIKRASDGKEFQFREQSALVDFPNGERRVIALSLEKGQGAYGPGEYNVLDSSFTVDRNGKLQIDRLHLAPVTAVVEAGRRQAG